MYKFAAFAFVTLVSLNSHAYAEEFEEPNTEHPIEDGSASEAATDDSEELRMSEFFPTCGGPQMSNFYAAAIEAFAGPSSGKVKIKNDGIIFDTKFLDVNCPSPGQSVVIQFDTGEDVTLTSYFGSYLPSPTGSVVQAFYGTLRTKNYTVENAKFWLDSQSNLTGLLLRSGNSYFQLSSQWFTF